MGDTELRLAVVVAAAGYGTRLDSGLPKQYVPLLGIPMIQRTLSALNACPKIEAMLVVVNWEDVDYCRSEIASEQLDAKVLKVVAGGEKRPESVRNGLLALAEMGTWDLVGVHDGARPLVTCAEVERVVAALEADPSLDGAVPGIPSTDTVKIADEAGIVVSTPDRRFVWRAQTPQIFRWPVLMDAYTAGGVDELGYFTDDASLVEARGGRVKMVEGSPENFKITDRLDLQHAEQILAERRI
jgi:2-C-methyl-D-erythritol 4-phosphate cytidylyltransferase